MKQKEIFLLSEGDAWFTRNKSDIATRNLPEDDILLMEILNHLPNSEGIEKIQVLEIGCGDGSRLEWIKNNMNADCFGVEPSALAVKEAGGKGINVQRGTADLLPYENNRFDIVVFGFCLYLCDREDLFQIASEANRVLRAPGWLMILDFYSSLPRKRTYHHRDGVQSYKMDYRDLFIWHPSFECMTHKVRHHTDASCTDDSDEWVAVSVLRKYH